MHPVCDQPPRPTQPYILCWAGNEYRPKCDDALRLRVKAGWLVLYVDKHVGGSKTRADLSALEVSFIIERYTNPRLYLYTTEERV